jgi:hypothetical protein
MRTVFTPRPGTATWPTSTEASRRGRWPRLAVLGLGAVTLAATLFAACDATKPAGTGGSGGTGGAAGQGGSGGTAGMGGAAGGGGQGGLVIEDDAGTGGFNQDAACVGDSVATELIPLDILVLLDRSGSMSGQKWDGSVDALTTFVNDPASAGINVGITYYPLDAVPDECDHTLYDVPVVPVGPLPANAAPFVQSLIDEDPNGGSTPTYGALKGALLYAVKYQDMFPEHKVVVVFASDGDPNSCPINPVDQNTGTEIAKLAASALAYNGVQTYVIAIQGSTLSTLNQIAASGGTGQAFDVTGNINAFADKMAEIRENSIVCEFLLPAPPPGQALDPSKVAVTYTPGGMGVGSQIPKADNESDCADQPGWYYDDPADPKKIILCPASCGQVQVDPLAKVDVVFGCQPQIN